jgi:hypothetical protein
MASAACAAESVSCLVQRSGLQSATRCRPVTGRSPVEVTHSLTWSDGCHYPSIDVFLQAVAGIPVLACYLNCSARSLGVLRVLLTWERPPRDHLRVPSRDPRDDGGGRGVQYGVAGGGGRAAGGRRSGAEPAGGLALRRRNQRRDIAADEVGRLGGPECPLDHLMDAATASTVTRTAPPRPAGR